MKTGKRFTYTEMGYSAPVTVIEDKSDDEWERYLIRLDGPLGPTYDTGDEFEVDWRKGYANILWRLTPLQ